MPDAPTATQTAARLTEFAGRGAGSDAERRAAWWLHAQVQSARREATIETFWCRPNWAMAHSWHVLLALAGSLVMVSQARLGGVLVLVSLASVLADGLTGRSLGRRVTPERASQNVIGRPRTAGEATTATVTDTRQAAQAQAPVRLIVTANYDAGRTGRADRGRLRRIAHLADRVTGRSAPGWLGWVVILELWLLAVAVGRQLATGPTTPSAIAVAQLVPTIALVVGLVLLVDLAAAPFGPAASDNAAGTAVAIALVSALDAAAPRELTVELVLQGAGDRQAIGLDRYLRRHRGELSASNTVVLGLGPVGGEQPCWWSSDGPLIARRFHRGLRELAGRLAPELGVRPRRGRGTTAARPARVHGLPAITLGCVSADGRVPRSHRADDVAAQLPVGGLDELARFARRFVEALDADLAGADATRAVASSPEPPDPPDSPASPDRPASPDPPDGAAAPARASGATHL